ncbi:MAG: ATP-binding protein [Nocardioides sp.]
MSTSVLAEMAMLTEEDVFVGRQLGRQCALTLGFDRLDALRVATAVSEVGREIVSTGSGALTLTVRGDALLVELRAARRPSGWDDAIASVRKLVDRQVQAAQEDGVRVVLEKWLSGPPPSRSELQTLRRDLLAQNPSSPAAELREQNRELLAALEEVRAQRAELEVVNAELEETNRGVMELYAELSAELDHTNQGVVALYAEIDDKNLQLRHASEAKSRFLRSISHELRTPVNSILGLTGLLLDPHQPERLGPEHAEQVQYIRTSTGDLRRLVDELLDLAKAESGRLQPTVSEIDLRDLFEELRGVIEPIVRPGVALEIDVAGPETMMTDPDLLRHVLRNLLSNAAKFTESGAIGVSVHAEDQEAVFTVRDTGLGISLDDQARIFEEFYQATSPLHASTKGTGLGLPFAQVVATALGGHIEVMSTLGEGSTFTVRLPMEARDA